MKSMGNYSGMTTNERLFAAGLLDAFDAAVVRGDRKQMIDILQSVDVLDPERVSETILSRPTRYGRIKQPSDIDSN